MKLYTAGQMRGADAHAINELGTPSITLMERASRHISDTALEMMSGRDRAAIFCGSGNNGGDGFGAAVNLAELGMKVRVFLVGDESRFTHDTAEMAKRLGSMGVAFEKFIPSGFDAEYLSTCGVIIDAIYGFGFHLPFGGDALAAAKYINTASVPVLAADMPSGVEADTGLASESAVRADVTVTFSGGKVGQFILPGALFCGDVRVCPIGADAPESIDSTVKVFTVDNNFASMPPRRLDSHKGDFGKALIVGGCVGYTGAPSLAAHAAVKSGAGLVFLGVPDTIYIIEAVKNDEAMPFPLPTDSSGDVLFPDAADIVLEKMKNCGVCLIGPGLGRSVGASETVKKIVRESNIPLVIDADGINAIAENINVLDEASCPVILTPHDGEFARLGGDVSKGRIAAASEFACTHRCTVVLKGFRTVTAFPDGTALVNTSGGPSMAKGGSGDVLAGMITALLGQMPLEKAVPYAVYLHGKAGDIAAGKFGEYSMTPSDVISVIHEAMR